MTHAHCVGLSGVSFRTLGNKGFYRTWLGHHAAVSGPEADMSAFVTFEQDLQDALSHLYDPVYRPSALLRQILGGEFQQGMKGVRAMILQAVEDLKPESNVPDTARAKRVYGILFHKYVQNLSQEETAERLGITSRHLRREQPEVIRALALYLWEKGSAAALSSSAEDRPGDGRTDLQQMEWRTQVKEELASLTESAPSTVASVVEVVEAVVTLESALADRHDVQLESHVQVGLVATIHPSALRQVLITAVGQLIRWMSAGSIVIQSDRHGQKIVLRVIGEPVDVAHVPDSGFITEILDAQDGSVEVDVTGRRVSFVIEVCAAEQTILVVDDNMDLAHLYRRYAMGTPFNIVHLAQGQRVLEVVEAYRPAAIVLDVMLPDIDGWLLLSQLHERPSTRNIPVVVCSVVREEELARALGAQCYLQKPVQRQQFIQALRQALDQAEAA